ncbi:hypothetical protein M427DRAFT_326739 [Gonapodya prolifera JEL478]|uniref:Uncharacterized protein n=1 Tax=Gonapodya prolifera (strain JEL478) TaxID=1344416 RepID=A0A139AEQ2_GONPJ|nr:hypothetical protein M427DRAFT_326739 [Gonapodya prolifera JEL478]|eukprot:KXS15257.1 hypothetical protein M427DRAFT_326739 [Gonapodya prolifera JEL478]
MLHTIPTLKPSSTTYPPSIPPPSPPSPVADVIAKAGLLAKQVDALTKLMQAFSSSPSEPAQESVCASANGTEEPGAIISRLEREVAELTKDKRKLEEKVAKLEMRIEVLLRTAEAKDHLIEGLGGGWERVENTLDTVTPPDEGSVAKPVEKMEVAEPTTEAAPEVPATTEAVPPASVAEGEVVPSLGDPVVSLLSVKPTIDVIPLPEPVIVEKLEEAVPSVQDALDETAAEANKLAFEARQNVEEELAAAMLGSSQVTLTGIEELDVATSEMTPSVKDTVTVKVIFRVVRTCHVSCGCWGLGRMDSAPNDETRGRRTCRASRDRKDGFSALQVHR